MIKYILVLLCGFAASAQTIITGNIRTENNSPIQNVTIINMQTGKVTQSNTQGEFKIEANANDEIQFVKEKYDRLAITICNENLSQPISIHLIQATVEIKQVILNSFPSGNFAKDMKNSKTMDKSFALNGAISKFMKTPTNEPKPTRHISIAAPKDPNEGQVTILSVSTSGESSGILGALIKQIKPTKTSNRNSEKEIFYQKIKHNFYDT